MKNRRLFSLLAVALTLGLFSDLSSAAECDCVPTAQLTRVAEGTFALKLGESTDLTNSGVLLTFHSEVGYNPGFYNIRINGKNDQVQIGERFDLKKYTSRLKDRDECWLDFYKVIQAKGAPLTGAFRLDCP